METPSGYLFDGYETDAHIVEKPGIYPAVTFRFKPVLAQNLAVVLKLIGQADPRKGEEIAAELVERQVVSWDLAARLRADETDPQPVPIRAEHILRLHPYLSTRIFRIVTGEDAGDVKPSDNIAAETGA